MNKKQVEFSIYPYGEYSKWDRTRPELPKILDITDVIQAEIGTEFGYVLHILRGKGKTITFRIIHPPFDDETGNPAPDFTGEYFINSNDFRFFLGDCVWEPLEDKLGKWRLITYLEGKVVADKTLTLINKQP